MHVTPFNCRPKPKICRLKPVICRPAQEHSRHEPVMDCRPEPPCVVTDIPKRGTDKIFNLVGFMLHLTRVFAWCIWHYVGFYAYLWPTFVCKLL